MLRVLLRAAALAFAAALAAMLPAAPVRADDGVGDRAQLGDRALAPGMTGADVEELQRTLNRLELRMRITGTFDARTEELVRRYERREDITEDGRVSRGQARGMRRRAGTLPFGSRELSRGHRGGDVRRLQKVLTDLGINTEADGIFGPGTERRVRRYERREDLRVNGEVSRGQARGMLRRLERRGENAESAPARPAEHGTRWFPIAGRWRWGGEGAGFAERGGAHQGEDVFAGCGTPLVAAETGRVVFADSHSRAGHYVVVRGVESGEDHVYMHLAAPAEVARYATVKAGQRIGEVGDSGNAHGCHLHFEVWTAPGWYEGGSAYDPRPLLEAWAEETRARLRAAKR